MCISILSYFILHLAVPASRGNGTREHRKGASFIGSRKTKAMCGWPRRLCCCFVAVAAVAMGWGFACGMWFHRRMGAILRAVDPEALRAEL